jgi:hypothetical protein
MTCADTPGGPPERVLGPRFAYEASPLLPGPSKFRLMGIKVKNPDCPAMIRARE